MKNNKGITLIALVVTIIVLLILAGVSIAMLTGQNGILNRASNASVANAIGEAKDAVALEVSNAVSDYYAVKYTSSTADNLVKNEVLNENAGSSVALGNLIVTRVKALESSYPDVKIEATAASTTGETTTAGSIKITSNKDSKVYTTAALDKDGKIQKWVDTGF